MGQFDRIQQSKQREKEQTRQKAAFRPVRFRQTSEDTMMNCPHCGSNVPAHSELCPVCGKPLHLNICTYCGAEMSPDDRFCSECGGARSGVICPKCNTLNFRSFCSHCNTALDELAQEELEKAERDPIFIRMKGLAQKLAEMEEKMLAAQARIEEAIAQKEEESATADFSESPTLSAEDQALVDEYKQLMEQMGIPAPPKVTPAPTAKPKPARQAISLKAEIADLKAIEEEYAASVAEMNELMTQLIPDPGATPQMQRNYFSARKLPVYRKELRQEPSEWVCNYCGCHHSQPSECAEPQLGGYWIYHRVEVTVKSYEYQ
ncbi:MAG: zinc ribbon domain-containing protein [Bacteroidaceae bacterium]|nr:zinc ribbon domain-containing protein [Bacteroidaceae bacterium]